MAQSGSKQPVPVHSLLLPLLDAELLFSSSSSPPPAVGDSTISRFTAGRPESEAFYARENQPIGDQLKSMSRETPGIPWRCPLYQLLIVLPNLFSWRTGPSSNVCYGRDKEGNLVSTGLSYQTQLSTRLFSLLQMVHRYSFTPLLLLLSGSVRVQGYNARMDYLTTQVALGRNPRYKQETPQVLKKRVAVDATIIEKLRLKEI